MRCYVSQKYHLSNYNKLYYNDAKQSVLKEFSRNPLKEYLNSLVWDGNKRLDDALHHYLGAEDCKLNRAMIRKTLVAACKRAFEPGCKFDYVLVLQGVEGCGKSMFLHILAGEFFNDSEINLRSIKDAYEQVNSGAWIHEFSDMAGICMRKGEELKGFISSRCDIYRKAYG